MVLSMHLELEKAETVFISKKRPQFLAAAGAGIGTLALANVVAWTSPAFPGLQNSEAFADLTAEELTWIASLVPFGAIVSGPIAGFFIEKIGRQRSMFLMCIPFVLGWLSIAFAQHVSMFYIGRFLTGICAGALCLMSPIYISEITEESIRGLACAPSCILCGVGILMTYFIGSIVSWQVLTLICASVPLLFMLCMFFVPETPLYLLGKDQKKKAGEALMWLRGAESFGDIQDELNDMQERLEDNDRGKFKLRHLVALDAIKPLGIALMLVSLQQLAGINIVIFYAAKIFKDAGSEIDPFTCSIIIGGVLLVSTGGSILFIDKLGRKILLLLSSAGSAISLVGLGTYFHLKAANGDIPPENLTWLPLTTLITFSIFFSIGLGPLPWIYMAEILPAHIKGTGSAICTSVNWMMAFLITKTYEDLNSALGIDGCYWMFAGFCAFGVLFILFFLPETKGKSLDEIQDYFKPPRPATRFNVNRY